MVSAGWFVVQLARCVQQDTSGGMSLSYDGLRRKEARRDV
jgi:hypothetical protein